MTATQQQPTFQVDFDIEYTKALPGYPATRDTPGETACHEILLKVRGWFDIAEFEFRKFVGTDKEAEMVKYVALEESVAHKNQRLADILRGLTDFQIDRPCKTFAYNIGPRRVEFTATYDGIGY